MSQILTKTKFRAEISRNFGWMDDFCSPPGGWNTVCQMDEIK